MDLNGTERLFPASHATFRELRGEEGGGLLLHLRTADYFRVNRFGAAIWRILEEEERPTVGRVAERLRALIDEAPPDLHEDVAAFVGELARRDLVRIEGGE